jgi:hypothetical protein
VATELLADPETWLRERLATLQPYHDRISAIVNYQIPLHDYLVYSSVFSIFLMQRVAHAGVDIFLGYPIILLNTLILFVQDRLIIHRNHIAAIFVVTVISFIASANSDTPGYAIIAQVMGILLFSVYFFTLLTNFGLSVPRWMQIYTHIALAIVVIGFITYIGRKLLIPPSAREEFRLRSIFAEPSLFVYLTLPAFGIYVNAFLRHRRYKLEVILFFLAYVLAGSSLGFLGILFIAFFALLPRLSFGKMIGFCFAALGALVGLFFASADFRLRVVDTVISIARANLGAQTNASTFAFLSNAYVTIQTFISHPLIGVGIGGYQYAYTKFAPFIGADVTDPALVGLNMFDANSMFMRAAAEFGLFGLCVLVGFLVICSRVRGDQHVDIRNALLPYLLVRMSRLGAWFTLELYFFVGLFVLNYMHSRASYGGRREPEISPPSEPA